jgi:predicted membrane-bound mannosyltransferase
MDSLGTVGILFTGAIVSLVVFVAVTAFLDAYLWPSARVTLPLALIAGIGAAGLFRRRLERRLV